MFETTDVAAHVADDKPFNPIETINNLAGLQNSLNQNKMFQAKALAGQYMTRANGDPTKLNAFLMDDPRTAFAAPEIMGAALTQQGQGISNATGQQGLAANRATALQKVMASIQPSTATGPDGAQANKVEAITALAPLVASGVIDQKTFDSYAAMDPASFETARRAAVIAGQGGEFAQKANYGTVDTKDIGGALQPTVTNPVQQTVEAVGTPIAKTLPPEVKVGGIPQIGADNATYRTSVGEIYDDKGNVKPGAGHIQTGLAPGVEAGASAAATQGVSLYNAAATDAAASVRRVLSLKKALAGINDAQTGANSEGLNELRSTIQTFSPKVASALGINPNQVASYDEAKKYLTQYAAGTASAYGPGTDAKLAAAATGNASTHISQLAAKDVIRVNMGLERMGQAQVAAFNAAGQPGGLSAFPTWSANWARTVDPRAFMLDVLPKADRLKVLSSLKTVADQRAFLAGKRAAEAAGQFSEGDLPQ